jgi:hypothetical protein
VTVDLTKCPYCNQHWINHDPNYCIAPSLIDGKLATDDQSALKFDKDKPRFDLLPVLPLEEVIKVFTYGAKKYADRNWERGFVYSRPYGACLRHIFAWWRGESIDPESNISHLAHAACNILFLLEFELRKTGTDDRPYSNEKKDA